ncbi:MAG: tripartite tricarboxylate transporter permease [Candidatus Aenigmatarchaeota archaeon]
MFDLLFFCFFGIFLGFLAGLLPGIHPNQIYFFILLSGLGLEPNIFVVFLASISVSNIVFSYIPSFFLSLPDSSTIVNVLPAHKMVLKGDGLKALLISLTSIIIICLIVVLCLPLFIFLVPLLQKITKPFIHLLLLLLVAIMIIIEKDNSKRFFALFLFLISGIFGIVTLNSKIISSEKVLFPALTGLFGIPSLLFINKGKLPKQNSHEMYVKLNVKVILSGLLAGALAGILPGAGESQAGTVVSLLSRLKDEEIVGSLAGINIANLLFSVIALVETGNIRSGLAESLSTIEIKHYFLLFLGAFIFSLGFSCILCIFFSKWFLKLIEKIDYEKIGRIIIYSTITLTLVFTGIWGLLVLIIATSLGILPLLLGVKRTNNMGFLMLPVILHYSNLVM